MLLPRWRLRPTGPPRPGLVSVAIGLKKLHARSRPRQMHRHVHSAALQRKWIRLPTPPAASDGQDVLAASQSPAALHAVSGNHRLLPAHGSRHIHR